MKQPQLHAIPLKSVNLTAKGQCTITMDPGAWDSLLETAYDSGWTLIEIRNERPVKAYKKPAHLIVGLN